MIFNTNTNTTTNVVHTIQQISSDAIQLSVLGAFLYVQLVPAPALAFADGAHPRAVIVFSIDHKVVDTPMNASHLHKEGSVLGVTATAYSSTVAQTDSSPFITASGTKVRDGIIAANFLPLGTRVQIGNKEYVVEDRMNARYNNSYHVDIWMQSTEDAQTFGVRPLIVEIVELP